MPPRPMLPYQPAGMPDIMNLNTSSMPTSPASGTGRSRFVVTKGGPVMLPGDMTDSEAQQWVQAYDAYIGTLTQAWQESSGLQRKQIEAQIEDAKKGRENALQIAQMQDATSRYGTDVASRDRMAQLYQTQEQFNATHGLELAKAYTQFSSSPDMMFARNDFVNAVGRVGQGLGPRNVMSQGTPHANTWQDFAALSGYNTPAVQAGRSQGGGGGSPQMNASGGGSGSGTDQRTSAVNAIMKAMPPSDDDGYDGQDWEALNAIRSLYAARRPGSVARLGKERQKIANAGLARMGYDPNLVNEDYRRTLPGNQSVRRA